MTVIRESEIHARNDSRAEGTVASAGETLEAPGAGAQHLSGSTGCSWGKLFIPHDTTVLCSTNIPSVPFQH